MIRGAITCNYNLHSTVTEVELLIVFFNPVLIKLHVYNPLSLLLTLVTFSVVFRVPLLKVLDIVTLLSLRSCG